MFPIPLYLKILFITVMEKLHFQQSSVPDDPSEIIVDTFVSLFFDE